MGDGEVRALGREVDWASTTLGPVEGWSPTLRSAARMSMESPFPVALWCGPDLTLVYNDAYRSILGAKHPEALARPGSRVWDEIWDEIRPMFEGIRGGGPPVYDEDAPFMVDRTGAGLAAAEPPEPNAWFTFALSPVRDEDGNVVAFLNIVSETTGRVLAERARAAARARAERAEARLLEVFAHAPAFMAVLRGPTHVFEYVNNAYYLLVGERDLIGRPVFEALPELRGQGFETLLSQVMESGEPFVGREMPLVLSRRADGESEERFVDFVYYPIAGGDGTSSGIVAHGHDVTDHLRARQEAEAARAEAEDANQAKSRFLANMSHELRTPINAVVGYAELMEMGVTGPVTPKQRQHLERIGLSGRHLLALIDDILDLARVEAGRMDVSSERMLAADTITSALALVAPQAEERGVELENACAGDDSTVCVGDRDRVRQILVNLLSNAVKFTGSGGRVRVNCGSDDSPDPDLEVHCDGPLTCIRVSDTGIGIAQEDLEHIFEPFRQVDDSPTRAHGGTGLGLAISRHLALVMGGELTAESQQGRGSTFTLWLPREASIAPALEETLVEEVGEARPENLTEVGAILQAELAPILDRFVERVRRDPGIPMSEGVGYADLVDHTAAFLGDVAHALLVMDARLTSHSGDFQDGSEVQTLLAELHGRQRARLGWTGPALRREWKIMGEELERAVRRALPSEDVTDALRLVARLLDRADHISRRGLRHARAATVT